MSALGGEAVSASVGSAPGGGCLLRGGGRYPSMH